MGEDEAEPLDFLIESWRLMMDVKEMSQNTITLYIRGVNAYREWCAATGEDPVFSKSQTERFLDACKHQFDRGVATRTAYLKGVRRFVAWAVEEGELEADEVSRIKPPVPGKTLLPSISVDAHEAVLATCDPKSFIGKRDIALLHMLRTTGCRASELVGIQLPDITVRTRRALVHGKGRKDRWVAFTSETALALDRYMRARKSYRGAGQTTALWLNQSGAPMSYWGLRSMIERRGTSAGLEGVHAHQWRHLWARSFLRDGGDRGALKILGGWDSNEMVDHYTAEDEAERALEAYDRLYGSR